MFLSLKQIIPITTLITLIKYNPCNISSNLVYLTYPVMLPVMAFSLFYFIISFLRQLKTYQRLVDEIWLDKSGSEAKIIFRNPSYRKLRGRSTQEIFITTSLISPVDVDPIELKGIYSIDLRSKDPYFQNITLLRKVLVSFGGNIIYQRDITFYYHKGYYNCYIVLSMLIMKY
jgi:hypothetical protein